jgi:hypothetical protein
MVAPMIRLALTVALAAALAACGPNSEECHPFGMTAGSGGVIPAVCPGGGFLQLCCTHDQTMCDLFGYNSAASKTPDADFPCTGSDCSGAEAGQMGNEGASAWCARH